jgi:SAM-dependent methyltransferase
VRWLAKAALQKGMSALPRAESVNYVFQRHVSRSLPSSPAAFRRKFTRALAHLEAYAAYGPSRPVGEAVFYEFGAGWDLAVQLAYWSLGVERQLLIDLHSHLRLDLVEVTLERLRREHPALEVEAGRELRAPGRASIGSARELEERFGITYLAPRDARATDLVSHSVDFVSSTNTLEHVPASGLIDILVECRRLLRHDGAMSSRIDLRDHYSYFDRSVSPYNFLRYSDRAWWLFNSSLLYQNRLRRPDYLQAVADAGLSVVGESATRPTDPELAMLDRIEVAPRFRSYSVEDLAVVALVLVARPAAA